jgi:hypothetical protein
MPPQVPKRLETTVDRTTVGRKNLINYITVDVTFREHARVRISCYESGSYRTVARATSLKARCHAGHIAPAGMAGVFDTTFRIELVRSDGRLNGSLNHTAELLAQRAMSQATQPRCHRTRYEASGVACL